MDIKWKLFYALVRESEQHVSANTMSEPVDNPVDKKC